jgi:hypothetical protein
VNQNVKTVLRWIDRTLIITLPLGGWMIWRWVSHRTASEISPDNSLIYLVLGAVVPWLLQLAMFIAAFQLAVRWKKVPGEGGIFGLWFLIGAGVAVPVSWLLGKFLIHQTLLPSELFWLGFRYSALVALVPCVLYLAVWLVAILVIKRD